MSKLNTRNKIWGVVLVLLLPLLFFLQSKQTFRAEALYEVKGVYKKMKLKQHRIYKLQLSLKDHEDNFILDKSSYGAWEKHQFKNIVKSGDSLSLFIPQTKMALLNNNQEDLIQMMAMKNRHVTFLKLEEFNLFRNLNFIKFYVFWGIAFIIWLYLVFFNKRTKS